jgi:hypothetical protein
LEPKRRFTIVCEGQNTEPDYFRAVQAALRDTLVDLVIEPAAGVPLTIAKRAADIRHRKGKRDSFEEKDEIWAVFDRDDHPNFDEAIRLCNAKNVGVARSNPCFEIWLILHHTDFNRPDGRHAVQAHLQTLDREYDPRRGKRLDCGRLMNQLTTAEQRAERQLTDRHAEGNPFGPPSTTVFQLTRAIALAAAKSRPK